MTKHDGEKYYEYINVKGEICSGKDALDKITEVEPREFVAFGVKVISRYGQAPELIAALQFLNSLSGIRNDMLLGMESIHYDSKGGYVNITLHEDVPNRFASQEDFKRWCDEIGEAYLEFGGTVSIGTDSVSYDYVMDFPYEDGDV